MASRTINPVSSKLPAFLLCVLCGALTACGDAPEEGLRFGLATAPVTLDPRFATDAVSTRIDRLLYARLVDFDDQFRPRPALARWERQGLTRYRFRLDDDRRPFHDGTPVTAADVKATYDSVLDPATASPHRGGLTMIAAVEVQDAATVDFQLTQPDPLFPGRLTLGILPAARLKAGQPFNREPLGSGPFSLRAWPEEGRLELRRVGDGATVVFFHVPDSTVRVLKLLRGELDLVQDDLPPELVAWLDGRDEVAVHRSVGSNFGYLGFNLEDPLTGQLALRQAVAHAIDREAIIRHVMGRAARPAEALLPPDHWAGLQGLGGHDFDLERSRRLLTDLGYGPTRPARLTYKTSNSPFRVRLATVIQHQLKAAGIHVDVRSFDWGTFYGDVKAGRFQMYSLAWVGIKMPDIFRYVFHSTAVPPAGANRGRYRSTLVDRLVESAEAAESEADQAVLFRELQGVLYRELPYVPLWYEDHVVVTSHRVQGYQVPPDGNFDRLVEARWSP